MESVKKANDAVEILIAEDSPTQSAQLVHLLEQRGYAVTAARNGREALQLLERMTPALVITDVVMPEIDGYGLCHAIKSDARWKHLPVILVTTLADAADVIRGLECGADNFIRKPYEERYLLSRIDYLLMNLRMRKNLRMQMGVEISLGNQRHFITAERQQILDLLISTYEQAIHINNDLKLREAELADANQVLNVLRERLERLVEERTAELHESEERYRLIFDKNPHPTWVYDLDSLAFLAVNEAAVARYGYSLEEFLGMTIRDIRPPEEVPELLRRMKETPESPTPRVFGVFRHKTRSGQILDVEIASSEITFAGRHAGLVQAIDVTEKRRLEQQILRSQRMESIGTLAGGIAHDLNNLLMPVMIGVSLLKRTETSEQNQRALEHIERSAKRGKDLIKQVLSFARGVEGSRVPVHIGDVVKEVESIVESTFPKNVSMQVDVPKALWWIDGDPTQLNQVLLNLCVNARDAMPAGGHLSVAAGNVEIDEHYARMNRGMTAGQYVMIEVADEGIGIPPEIVERIFEPFFTTKDLAHGTGLGLSTVAAIVRSHGGFVNVYSEVGKGTAFRVYLPAQRRSENEDREAEAAPAEGPRGHGETILVVDDEASIRAILQQTLEAYGYRVLTAEDGAQAVGVFAAHRSEIAAVIADMMMPVLDGRAFIAAVRRIDPDVPIIASSGLPASSKSADIAAVGVDHFLHKPYSADVLLVTLDLALQRHG